MSESVLRLGNGLDGPGFESRGRGETDFFLFSNTSRPSLGHILPPIPWLERIYSEVKRLADDLDHSFSSSAKVANEWS
jgi:hypothetical protein